MTNLSEELKLIREIWFASEMITDWKYQSSFCYRERLWNEVETGERGPNQNKNPDFRERMLPAFFHFKYAATKIAFLGFPKLQLEKKLNDFKVFSYMVVWDS